MAEPKIDIVIPFVNGLDPEWQKIYKQYKEKVDFAKYDGHDILKYVFRSIEENVSWIDKVHLLVMQESQIPNWLDRSTVHVVYHNNFIPEKHLPLFNSSAIEMYLWNIPELSEHFIYINDDIIFNNEINISDHFDEKIVPKVTMTSIRYRKERVDTDYAQTFINSCILGAKGTENENKCWNSKTNVLFRPGHGPQAYNKSLLKMIYDTFEQEIENSITKFRDKCNYNQYLFGSYLLYNGISNIKRPTYSCIAIKEDNKFEVKGSINSNVKEICLNDVDNTKVSDKLWLRTILNRKFPNKCKYEK